MNNPETLLRILFANGHEDIVALAVKIDAGIEEAKPDKIRCRLSKHELDHGTQFEKAGYNGVVDCPVIFIDQYRLKEKYLVELPNGEQQWKSHFPGDKLTSIENIPEVTEKSLADTMLNDD